LLWNSTATRREDRDEYEEVASKDQGGKNPREQTVESEHAARVAEYDFMSRSRKDCPELTAHQP
jgi:hypothetical protein